MDSNTLAASIALSKIRHAGEKTANGKDALDALVHAHDILVQLEREDVTSMPVVGWITLQLLALVIQKRVEDLTETPGSKERLVWLQDLLANK